MNYLLPIVIGTTAFMYIHTFNYMMKHDLTLNQLLFFHSTK
jgi:hypothetical protein